MNNKIAPSTFGFLVMPGFPMACLTSAIEPLRAANEISGTEAFRWLVVGESKASIESSAAVNFDPDVTLHDLTKIDALYFLSSPLGRFQTPSTSNAAIRRLERSGITLGGFSGGVFPLVRSETMEGRKCSVHWVYEAAFRAEFPEIDATDRVITIDRHRETASGAAAVFDLMLQRIDQKLGTEIMTEVACWFQHPYLRGDDVAQRIPTRQMAGTTDTLPDHVTAAIRMFAEHIEDPVRVSDVADAINLSSRQLDRAFQRATGQSPLKYYRMMRLEQARQMVLYSSDTIAEISLAVGYASSSPMIRHYKTAFGKNPQEDRERLNSLRVEKNAPLPAV